MGESIYSDQLQQRGVSVSIRAVKKILKPKPTLEGAGVKLQRGFGFGDPKEFDPFLLFDDFRNDNPDEYLAGFPWHPHRGIETITYVLAGSVEHGDSLGNRGRSEEHTSELQSRQYLVCRLLLEKKKKKINKNKIE